MARTETYNVPYSQCGFNHNPNIDEIPPTALIHPSRNMNLDKNGAETRGGNSHVHSAAYGGSAVMGLFDYTLNNGTQFLMALTTDGKLWKNTTTSIHTFSTTGKYPGFSVMNNVLYVCNGANTPQTWDGSAGTSSDVAALASDWTGSNFPQIMIKHGRGNSERFWAIGCSSNPNDVYYSATNDGTEADFSGAGSGSIYIETEGSGLTGGIEFGDRLILFDRLRSYVIDDADTSTSNWGYQASQFKSGLANFRLVVKTENDIVAMQEDGTIYSVTAVQSYGDYKLASLTEPAYIDEWIQEYINLTLIAKFHMIYDPTNRVIKTFMVYNGSSNVDVALPYFIDRGPLVGWATPHDNQDYASGYHAVSSCLYRSAVGSYKVYTGDTSGNVWELETSSKNDNSNAFVSLAKTPRLNFENARMTKRFMRGFLLTKASGNHRITVTIWVNNRNAGTATVSLNNGQAVWGVAVWGSFVWADADEIIDQIYRINGIGERIQFEFRNNNADEPFYISQNLTDFSYLRNGIHRR